MGALSEEKLSPPRRIGSYELRRLLGRGATASVFECRHTTLGRLAAIKVLHSHLARERVSAARFLREGRALSRIVHPNVIEVFDVGTHDEVPYLVMSLVDGDDLGEHLRRHHPLSVTMIADFILSVASALAAAHDAGIVHRDLKPSNIRLARDHLGDLTPKVLDFGISKLTEDDDTTDLTDTNGALGTASYMAPEQLRSAKRADARSDLYALGVILYECATGKRPFRGTSGYDLMHAVLTAPVPPPSVLRPDLPAALDAIVLRAMRRDPSERFACARELGRALAPLASEPANWLREFAPSSDHRRVAPELHVAESGEDLFTLTSKLDVPPRSRASRMALAATGGVVCVAVAGAIAVVARPPKPPVSSGSAAVLVRTPTIPATASSPLAASTAPLAPERIEASETGRSPPPNGVGDRRAHPSPTPRPSAAIPPDVARRAPPKEETGTNGAPILE
jgi:serine/threonine protein kinase